MPARRASGNPGIAPRWTSSAKTAVGTALSTSSRVWFTLSHGILNEIYFPNTDVACTRDFGLIVTGDTGYFSEEKRHTRSCLRYAAPGVPACQLVNTCAKGRYRVVKEVLTDFRCDSVIQQVHFEPLEGTLADYRLYALLAPHLGNCGNDNTAWTGEYKGVPMLFARRDGYALALACSAGWRALSVGFVGRSDGWQDLAAHGRMLWHNDLAEHGNVALTGEIDLIASDGTFSLAVGFGHSEATAAQSAVASLKEDFGLLRDEYVRQWLDWHAALQPLDAGPQPSPDLCKISAALIRTHESKSGVGGLIASLSIPWGFSKGDEDLGGYHLVWPRDLVEAAGGLLAIGAHDEVRRLLGFLRVVQEEDGHWVQNMWLDGRPFWSHLQMDETALPILLLDLAVREGALETEDIKRFWPMAKRAASYLVRNGPVTQQDRWEQDPGYSPFTLAVEITALLIAADLADANNEVEIARYLRETADSWNSSIERWLYVSNTEMALRAGVDGYYVRVAAPEEPEAASPKLGFVPIKNRTPDSSRPAGQVVSPDALALVRFGLREANDPRIESTVKVIDALLRTETPYGFGWRRHNEDCYGEQTDGSPFNGAGIGRLWPLLTGERAHYELAAGRADTAFRLLGTMESFANEGGLIPEQIWDAADIPERELYFGRPSGSAMPLVWAHAEYLKLRRSLRDGRVFDLPRQTKKRYGTERIESPHAVWRFNQKIRIIPCGKVLRIETLVPAMIHWSANNWMSTQDSLSKDTGLGMHLVDLPTDNLHLGAEVLFTFYWTEVGDWENRDFAVRVE